MKKVLFTATVDSHILQFHLPFLKMFKDAGYEVHVATNSKEKIPYCDIKHNVCFERNPYRINNIKAIKQLKKIIDSEKFDIIHTHTPMGSVVTRLAARFARKKYNTRVIYTAHGFHFYKGSSFKNWIIYYTIEKWMAKYTDTLITINQEDYNLARRKFNRRCQDIQYVAGVGIDEKKYDFEMTNREKNELRRKLGLDKDDIILIFPARLDENKNQAFLINAMQKLVKYNDKIHLLLPGQDELNGKYQKLVNLKKLENNIHFLGYRNDINKLLKISNIGVASSIREGLGLNLIEAIFSGLPVVATKNRGHNEIIKDGINGFLVDSVDDFVSKIKIIIDNPLSYANKESVKQFCLSQIIPVMNSIYFNNENSNDLLFVHTEEKMKIDKIGNKYTDGCYNSKIWERYFNYTTNITAIFRKDSNLYEPEEAKTKFQQIPNSVKVLCVEDKKRSLKDFFSIRLRINNNRTIKNEVKKSKNIILRVPCDDCYTAFKYAKKYSKNVIVEVVGCPLDTLWHHGIKGKVLAFPSYLRMKKCIKQAKNVLYVTNEFLQKRYPNNYNNIGCSDVEIPLTEEKVIKNRLSKINKTDKTIVIGTIGNIDNKYKGQQDVIKVIPILEKEGYKIVYKLVGGGDKKYLYNIVKKEDINQIEFLGSIPHDNVFPFLDSIDLYIQPSYTEGLCRSVIEAISRGCPCVVSDAGGNPELINKKYVYQKGNIKDLSKKILNILKEDNLSNSAIENFEKSKEYYSTILDEKRNEFYSDIFNNRSKPIKILHVVNRMGYGGIEAFIMNIYRKIDTTKIQFDFAVHNNNPGEYDSEIKKLGGKIYYFPSRRKNPLKYICRWKNFLKEYGNNYNSIHMHVSSLTTIIPIVYAKKYNIKNRIVHAHSTAEIGYLHKITCFFNKKRIQKYANYLLACSKIAGDFVFGDKDFVLIPNGIPIEKYYFNDSVRKKVRKQLKINNDTLCYVHVGRFCYAKNHEFLLNVFKIIHSKNGNSKLFLIGDGELRTEIESQIERMNLNNSVILLGNINNVNEYLMAMDCLIFPSRYEGLPLSIIEAQATGISVYLSSNVTDEVNLSDNITFLPLEIGANEWAKRIMLDKNTNRLFDKKIKKYDINHTVEELERIYYGG